jgi:hypothetical protein
MRSASWSSQSSFESVESSGGGNSSGGGGWHNSYLYQRPAPLARPRFRVKKAPGELFAALPGEVLELILDELKQLHLAKGSDSCATCWMRDLCSVSLSARKWYKFARTAL